MHLYRIRNGTNYFTQTLYLLHEIEFYQNTNHTTSWQFLTSRHQWVEQKQLQQLASCMHLTDYLTVLGLDPVPYQPWTNLKMIKSLIYVFNFERIWMFNHLHLSISLSRSSLSAGFFELLPLPSLPLPFWFFLPLPDLGLFIAASNKNRCLLIIIQKVLP